MIKKYLLENVSYSHGRITVLFISSLLVGWY